MKQVEHHWHRVSKEATVCYPTLAEAQSAVGLWPAGVIRVYAD